MASTFFGLAVDVGVGTIVVGKNGSIEQTSLQFHPQSISQGNSSPNITLNVKEFDSVCAWLE